MRTIETREQNLSKILEYLKAQNIRFKLLDGVFKYNPDTVKEEWLREWMEEYRPSLTYILRLQSGICTDCGIEPITRPQMRGQLQKWCERCYWLRVPQPMTKGEVDRQDARERKQKEEGSEWPSLDLE